MLSHWSTFLKFTLISTKFEITYNLKQRLSFEKWKMSHLQNSTRLIIWSTCSNRLNNTAKLFNQKSLRKNLLLKTNQFRSFSVVYNKFLFVSAKAFWLESFQMRKNRGTFCVNAKKPRHILWMQVMNKLFSLYLIFVMTMSANHYELKSPKTVILPNLTAVKVYH